MIRAIFLSGILTGLLTSQVAAQSVEGKPKCKELVALFIELGKRSGQTMTEEQAVAEVMSEDPSDDECGMMLALFPKQG